MTTNRIRGIREVSELRRYRTLDGGAVTSQDRVWRVKCATCGDSLGYGIFPSLDAALGFIRETGEWWITESGVSCGEDGCPRQEGRG